METCRELGITIVAYGALGRGFLTEKFRSIDDFDPDDIRRNHPRFQAETFAKNLELADKFSEFAISRKSKEDITKEKTANRTSMTSLNEKRMKKMDERKKSSHLSSKSLKKSLLRKTVE
ncbi:unnamed protein product [Rhizophagus irregularis]|nr:unnamed protein product [Rhizophagus irregularis]